MMVSNVVAEIEQPSGGFLNPNAMEKIALKDTHELYPWTQETITGGEMGMVVDYLTRFQLTGKLEESFEISVKGAQRIGAIQKAEEYLHNIKGIDKESIIAAVHLVGFDVFVRNPMAVVKGGWCPSSFISDETVSNVQVMVNRCLKLFEEYGPIKGYHLVFPNAYTSNVSSGDADYMTTDTLWDLKTSKQDVGIRDTFQMLLYYLLSQHSDLEKYGSIKKIGIYNPRLNSLYRMNIDEIDSRILKYIEKFIIGYEGENITLSDLIKALDERPKYPHYPIKKDTRKLLEKLIVLDGNDREKIFFIRATKPGFIRSALADCIEEENIKTTKEAYLKLQELFIKYNVKPEKVFLR